MKCKYIIHALFLCLFASCGGGAGSKPADSGSGQGVLSSNLNQVLDDVPCPNPDDFRGTGIGYNESEALAQARSNMALEFFSQKISSSVQISGQNIDRVASTSSKTSIDQDAALANAQDAKMHYSARRGNKTGVIACMSRSDAAKPYLQNQGLLMDSLEFTAAIELKAVHPRQKSEARDRANALWAKMLANNELLKSWKVESDLTKAKDLHDMVEDDYKDFCQTAKLHWKQEQGGIYSDIAFSKLTSGGGIKMEKTEVKADILCSGSGILLVYKGADPECSVKFGFNVCTYSHSLTVASCSGAEHLQLKNDITGSHQNPNFALDKLQGNLKSAEFWNQWIQEIKQWRPQCE